MLSKEKTTMNRLPVGIASLCIALCFGQLTLNLSIAPTYNDFVVGYIGLQNDSKLQDLLSPITFIAVFLSSYYAFTHIEQKLFDKQGYDPVFAFHTQLTGWSIPALSTILSYTLSARFDPHLLHISAAMLIALGIFTWRATTTSLHFCLNNIGHVLICVAFLSLIPEEAALIKSLLFASIEINTNAEHLVKQTFWIAGIALLLSLVTLMSRPNVPRHWLSLLSFSSQIGTPLLFLSLYPSRLISPTLGVFKYETTVWLKVALVAVVLIGALDVYRRHGGLKGILSGEFGISSIGIFAIIVALRWGGTVAPQISPDDYHFGEYLVGWYSYVQGMIPYVDHIPSHGIITNNLDQALATLFYDGTAASIREASRIGGSILAALAFFPLVQLTKSRMFPFVLILLYAGRTDWLVLVPFLCLCLDNRLQEKPAHWLSIWLLGSVLLILALPPQGVLLVASSGFTLLWAIYRLWSSRAAQSATWLSFSIVVLAVVLTSTPAGVMMLGAARYVLENGPINQIAYGVRWASGIWIQPQSGFWLEILRMSWVITPISCALFIHRALTRGSWEQGTVRAAILVLAFSVLIIPYSMGRIDGGGISRPGLVACLTLGIMLPLTGWLYARENSLRLAFLLLGAVSSSALSYAPPALHSVAQAATAIRTGVQKLGANHGMPNLGTAEVQEEHWQHLTKLQAILKRELNDHETYLDMTSRNAHYFYFGRKPVLPVTANYNMAAPQQQDRAVEQLTQERPRLALLRAENIVHDGAVEALRTPTLHRFIVDHYLPRVQNGFLLGRSVDSTRGENATALDVGLEDITDHEWLHGFSRTQAAVKVSDPGVLPHIRAGDKVQVVEKAPFRTVLSISPETRTIQLSGSPFPSKEDDLRGYPTFVTVIATDEKRAMEYKAFQLQVALGIGDYQKLPISWGRSLKALSRRMIPMLQLNVPQAQLHNLIQEGDTLRITGPSPYITFDLSQHGISGHEAGVLSMHFECRESKVPLRILMDWTRDGEIAPWVGASIQFTAQNGDLVVPMDASAPWLLMDRIGALRIMLDTPSMCRSIQITDVTLHRRQLRDL